MKLENNYIYVLRIKSNEIVLIIIVINLLIINKYLENKMTNFFITHKNEVNKFQRTME